MHCGLFGSNWFMLLFSASSLLQIIDLLERGNLVCVYKYSELDGCVAAEMIHTMHCSCVINHLLSLRFCFQGTLSKGSLIL